MDRNRFVPRVDGMEDRLTPALTPAQVNFALAYTQSVDAVIENLIPRLKYARTDAENLTIAVGLRGMAQGVQDAGGVLGQFRVELANQMAANPAGAGAMTGLAGLVANAQTRANVLSKTSENYGVGFGAAPLAVSVTNTSTDTGSTPSSGSGSSTDGSSPGSTSPAPTDNAGSPDTGTTTPTEPTTPPEPAKNAVGLSVSLPPIASTATVQPDGLKIQDIVVGTGAAVPAGGKATFYYTGWLASNGTEFDSNASTTPIQFDLNRLIKGWQEGIPGMQAGGVRRLYVPAALGYGAGGSPPKIPGNADLVFEIKVVSVP